MLKVTEEDWNKMEARKISLDVLASELNELFSISDWDEDPGVSPFLPRVYQDIGFDYTRTFEADFCKRCNRLILRSGRHVQEVFCAAFPTPKILRDDFGI